MKVRMILTLSGKTAKALAALAWVFTDEDVHVIQSGGLKVELEQLAKEMAAREQKIAVIHVAQFTGFNQMFSLWSFEKRDTPVVPLIEFDTESGEASTTQWTFHILPLEDIKQDGFYGKLFRLPV